MVGLEEEEIIWKLLLWQDLKAENEKKGRKCDGAEIDEVKAKR